MVRFGDICDLQNGAAFKPSDWSSEGFPIVRIQNLNNKNKSFNYTTKIVPERFHINSGDLLFSWSGTPGTSFGAYFWKGGKAYLNQHIFKLTIIKDEVFTPYLRSAINSKLDEIIFAAHGGVGLKHITKAKLENIAIPLPPLAEQKRIAAILDKADALRHKREKAIALTDTLLSSVFIDMFGDPVTNPKGWEVRNLENVISSGFQNGAYFPKEKYTSDKSGTEMVHMSDAFHGKVLFDKIKRVNVPQSEAEKYYLDHNDLLIARRSLTYEGAAKPCRVPKSDRKLIFESSLIKVTVNLNIIHPIYLYYYLADESVRKHFVFPNVTKSTISGINQNGLSKIQIKLPPISEQHRFVDFINELWGQNKLLSEMVENIDILIASLSQRAFCGELTGSDLSGIEAAE